VAYASAEAVSRSGCAKKLVPFGEGFELLSIPTLSAKNADEGGARAHPLLRGECK
jgi:hypothetical protein